IIAFDFMRSPLRVFQRERRTQSQDHLCRRNQRTAVKIKIVNPSPFGAIAQLGERIVRNDEVVGSIPTSSTNLLNGLATIAVIFVSEKNGSLDLKGLWIFGEFRKQFSMMAVVTPPFYS